MSRLWTMRCLNRRTQLVETECVIADCVEQAVEMLSSTHDEITFSRVDDLGKDWQ